MNPRILTVVFVPAVALMLFTGCNSRVDRTRDGGPAGAGSATGSGGAPGSGGAIAAGGASAAGGAIAAGGAPGSGGLRLDGGAAGAGTGDGGGEDASSPVDADASRGSIDGALDGGDAASGCSLPPRDCVGSVGYCSELVRFQPAQGVGYDDYPNIDETQDNQYRSYARRDLVMLVSHAAAFVQCKSGSFDAGNGAPLGLGDMSEQSGDIPGTSVGQPGHPAGTHTNGLDIDVAYYQLLPPDNHLRPVCPHTTSGVDQYHCTEPPDNLDVARTALFLGSLLTSSRVRLIGVDGMIGPQLVPAITDLCADGVLAQGACTALDKLAYETTDTGRGWFYFHHHNAHVSITP